MRERPPRSKEELAGCNISARCPHCKDRVSLIPFADPIVDFRDLAYFIARCPNSKRLHCEPIFAVYEALNDCLHAIYPLPGFDASNIDKAIPDGIRDDYAESQRCFYASAYKGTVALLRRVIEAAACNKLGADSLDAKGHTKKLWQLIDLMHQRGLITHDIRDAAHAVRLFGNYGAHVQDDDLDKVTRQEASEADDITWQILYSLFIVAKQTEALRQRLAAKSKPDEPSPTDA